MLYSHVVDAKFCSRQNRFIAKVSLCGKEVLVHVKNTGRLRELLVPGADVVLEKHDLTNSARKTAYSLIGVRKGESFVNIDSQAPNFVMHEALKKGLILPGLSCPANQIKKEAVFGSSRFDFFLQSGDQTAYLEIKGVTLEQKGIAMFPDAPTQRGIKHVQELAAAYRCGHLAYLIFIIQMENISCLKPNDLTHPAFGEAVRQAQSAGVRVLAYDCSVTRNSLTLNAPVPVDLTL